MAMRPRSTPRHHALGFWRHWTLWIYFPLAFFLIMTDAVNKGEIFTKPAPNTYGLVEFGEAVPQGGLLDAPES